MEFLTSDKLVICGAAGMIGSNMLQTAMMLRLTPNITIYDPYEKGLEGTYEEMLHCGFDAFNLQFSSKVEDAFQGAQYIVSSGGAARKAGMTREDLLKGNAEIAAKLGKDIKAYAPDVKHVVVVFNPADITGLVTLLHSGLKPSQVSTLAALDSTRLKVELSRHFNLPLNQIQNTKTYGGHGEQMAVFSSSTTINGTPLDELIGTDQLSSIQWEDIQKKVTQGGKKIIDLRGRSSFQSPAYLSIKMIEAVMGGDSFDWPVGAYSTLENYPNIMMALDTNLSTDGVIVNSPKGTAAELKSLTKSFAHLTELRDEVIKMGIIPNIEDWSMLNSNI
ncbi:malate dehydrogenase [Flammeovirga pacifica]|uniref:Malate dehydrogenase n=1 Tax=Flammeovirga pacifica TaxID=915059 RepID=A0A1S1YSJ4_FLAPC|nr:hypothetical protein [Flammeovirga pacifica]OHX64001.1 malate dehydrogenase [Flammeovirga pacifica]